MKKTQAANTRSLAVTIASVLLVLPVLYVASYLAFVDPYVDSNRPIQSFLQGNYNYRYGGQWIRGFFWPLEQFDRQLRPHMWRELPEPGAPVVDQAA